MLFFLVILGAWMGWVETVYGTAEGQASIPLRQDDAPLPEIPPMFRADPAVLEAQLIVQGKSTKRGITDGRVVR